MATVYGVNATLRNNVPKAEMGVGEAGGRVRLAYDSYTAAGAIALNDIVVMGPKIPKGARMIDGWIKHADLGTVGTLDLGWAASDDGLEAVNATGFISAEDVHTAADIVKATDNQAAPAGVGKKLLAEVQPIVTASAATDVAGAFSTFIFYIVD